MAGNKKSDDVTFSTAFISAYREYSTFEKQVAAPYLRKSFKLNNKPERAGLSICGLGFYELFINGNKITRGHLAPYISNPDDILYYDYYDIAQYLDNGENVIGVLLGNGMLNCPGGEIWDFNLARFRSAPKLAMYAEIQDGKNEISFEADESFLCHESPIFFDDLRCGEFYDARNELSGWCDKGYDTKGWTAAVYAETPRGECRLCMCEPVVAVREISPVSIRRGELFEIRRRNSLPVVKPLEDESSNSGWLYDFGVNSAGVCRLKIKGKPGQKIVMQFGETLDENGRLDLRTMSFLPERFNQRDIYICKSDEEETYTPSFTYHGFRYCLVLNITEEQATSELLTYVVMNSELSDNAGFECSSPVINRIYNAARVADYANFYYFPTDCPHREKNGWTGDANMSAEHMLQYMTAENSLQEWLHNIRKAQNEEGALPGIVPTSGWGFAWGNGPAWDQVIVLLPYYIWKYRGNTDVIRENAEAIMRYINYLTVKADDKGLMHIGLGDWLHYTPDGNPKSPLVFTDTVISMDLCHKSADMFEAIGMKAQAEFAYSVYKSFRNAAREHLLDSSTMTAYGDCVTSQAMAVYYGLLDDSEKQTAVNVLVRQIHEVGDIMDVGALGARVVFHVLSDFGYSELAYNMITNKNIPSYAHWTETMGATALFESFWKIGEAPNSCNHHFFGDVISWFMRNLAGIKVNPHNTSPDEVILQPRFIKELDYASGWENLPCGKVSLSWKREGDAILTDITIPKGCTAELRCDEGWQFENCSKVKTLRAGECELRMIRV